MTKLAFITGITGQDGSYLAELLIEKGYKVFGIVRRTSLLYSHTRIDHIRNNIHLEYGDMSDGSSLTNYLTKIVNDHKDFERFEIYNLAAQSHVKISFEIPEYTTLIDGVGTLKLLEAIRTFSKDVMDKTRFYQAGTSEMYGAVLETPQKETTPFNPQSPYACAKVYSHFLVKNYREGYGMYACNGVLFNHETLAGFMPIIFKQNNVIDIKPISEIVKYHTLDNGVLVNESDLHYQEGQVETDLFVWDNNDWTRVIHASGYPHDVSTNNKSPKLLVSKNAAYMATGSHEIIMEDDTEKCVQHIELGDKVKLVQYPVKEPLMNVKDNLYKNDVVPSCELQCTHCEHIFARKSNLLKHAPLCKDKYAFREYTINEDEAEFLGLFVGDGNNSGCIRFTNTSLELHNYVTKLWMSICDRNNKVGTCRQYIVKSGFKPDNHVYQTTYNGFSDFLKKYKIYNEDKTKRVPVQVLNASANIQQKFLEGYNKADGLKRNKCIYTFKNFKTNSATLAQGLLFLLTNTTNQEFNINVESVFRHNKNRLYYSINLLSNTRFSIKQSEHKVTLVKELSSQNLSQREISRRTQISRNFIRKVLNNTYEGCSSHHKAKSNNEIKKIIDMSHYEGWFYDLETESGKFHAGIGRGRIHNSPRRGENFVTMKIVNAVKKIQRQEDPDYVLTLGNLDSKRDWGHSKDYVYGMWLMLQQDSPDDYVLATGETYTVRSFVERCFTKIGKEIVWEGESTDEVGRDKESGKILVKIDKKYFRPCEVELLLGDPTKATEKLGWTRHFNLDTLIDDMFQS